MDSLLAEIETSLLTLIPRSLQTLKQSQPAYGLFLCYIDTTTDDHMPYLIVAGEGARQWAIERRGPDASHAIWNPQQELTDCGDFFQKITLDDPKVKALIERCYDELTDADDYSDDDVGLLPFRRMMWRVAVSLNGVDWQGLLDTTDDFVVVASDWSGFWVHQDAKESLPAAKLKRLKSRKLFFHKPTKAELAALKQERDAAFQKIETLPLKDQVSFWIREISEFSQSKPCLLRDNKWKEDVALSRLLELGTVAVLPLLDLAVELDALPHGTAKKKSLSASILDGVFSCINDIGWAQAEVEKKLRENLAVSCDANKPKQKWARPPCASAEVEKRLRKILADSCEANKPNKEWNRTPFLAASSLQRLFGEPYGFASMSFYGALTDWEKSVAAPYVCEENR